MRGPGVKEDGETEGFNGPCVLYYAVAARRLEGPSYGPQDRFPTE